MHCEICGAPEGGFHQCSKRALARREAMWRREELAAEECEEPEPTFGERLEVGFAMTEGTQC